MNPEKRREIENLLPYCRTESQRLVLETWLETGSAKQAANKLGKHFRKIGETLARVRKNAGFQGFSPEHDMVHPVPFSHVAKGVSTLYDADGAVKQQWVKSDLNKERYLELIKETAAAMCEDITPVAPTDIPTHETSHELLNVYPITDYHFGMKSWGMESGADWDLKIAEELFVKWFAAAIKQSPDAETALLMNIGDMLHTDGLDALTPTGKHLLDVDTRFQLVVRTVIRAFRCVVAMLLTKHKHVHIIMAEGNHDIASSVWLREMMCALYENEPRVTVDCSPDIYYCYEHGNTSIFSHHGHKAKFDDLDEVMVAKFREVFGRTKHSYAHMGHYHHAKVKESRLMIVEQHRTLAAPDAHASRHGYMSGRDAKVITYHKQYGEIGRISISPEMVM